MLFLRLEKCRVFLAVLRAPSCLDLVPALLTNFGARYSTGKGFFVPLVRSVLRELLLRSDRLRWQERTPASFPAGRHSCRFFQVAGLGVASIEGC